MKNVIYPDSSELVGLLADTIPPALKQLVMRSVRTAEIREVNGGESKQRTSSSHASYCDLCNSIAQNKVSARTNKHYLTFCSTACAEEWKRQEEVA